jgi:hypothetical protein
MTAKEYSIAHYGTVAMQMPAWVMTGIGVDPMLAGVVTKLENRVIFR